ncbi:hypothetical protein V6N13_121133 [Hibiscus sabdariffa]|uniref:Uncharacterized protein n=1 Tax=Hibiscus sabdariffa TaxID=183260 RepID=A0ABR2E6E4_9ROSI
MFLYGEKNYHNRRPVNKKPRAGMLYASGHNPVNGLESQVNHKSTVKLFLFPLCFSKTIYLIRRNWKNKLSRTTLLDVTFVSATLLPASRFEKRKTGSVSMLGVQ